MNIFETLKEALRDQMEDSPPTVPIQSKESHSPEIGQVARYTIPSFPECMDQHPRSPEHIWIEQEGEIITIDEQGLTVTDSQIPDGWRWVNRAFILK